MRLPLKEVQSTRTQRPTSGSSYPYVEIMIGDMLNQRITQLQLEQVCVYRGKERGRVDPRHAVYLYVTHLYLSCYVVSITLCVCVCFPGPGAVPSHCHAHGEHVVR